jgi:hypothetical protein
MAEVTGFTRSNGATKTNGEPFDWRPAQQAATREAREPRNKPLLFLVLLVSRLPRFARAAFGGPSNGFVSFVIFVVKSSPFVLRFPVAPCKTVSSARSALSS